MNTTETAPKAKNPRLNRIETVSRIVRYIILGFLVLSLGNALVSWLNLFLINSLAWTGLSFLLQVVLWVWYWKLSELFHQYQKGLIFASETIRNIKVLGVLCVINWVVVSAWRMANNALPAHHQPPPGVMITVHQSTFVMGFFSFSIGGMNLGMLLAGVIIVIIAWIMDEGRKIQEEQALTV